MTKPQARVASTRQLDSSPETIDRGEGSKSHLHKPGTESIATSSDGLEGALGDEQKLITEVLGDLDYVQLKERRVSPDQTIEESHQITIQSQVPKEKLSTRGEQLLGIIGHCSLKGHIAHFYNLRAEIERHIKSVAELEDERLLAAYNYLKSNPSTEAIFVYDNRMIAATRVGGRLIQKSVIAG